MKTLYEKINESWPKVIDIETNKDELMEDVREAIQKLIEKNEECIFEQRPLLYGEIKEIFGAELTKQMSSKV